MKLREKAYAGILAGWVSLLGAYGYARVKHGIENYAVIMFSEGVKANISEHSTKDSCQTSLTAYGYDIDGISRLELEVDSQNYIRREFSNLESVTEYSITIDFCSPELSPGTHEITVRLFDKNNDEETETGKINVLGGTYI